MVTRRASARGAAAGRVAAVIALVSLAACNGSGDDGTPRTSAPTPGGLSGDCGTFRIAYDPSNGYEASAFIVGTIAERALHCDVVYVKTTARNAWNLVANGDADAYLDAYGNEDLRAQLGVGDEPSGDQSTPPPQAATVTIVGPNGVKGAVALLAPAFMGDRGLNTAQDLDDTARIGWGTTTPAITTSPELVRLAHTVINSLRLDYVVRESTEVDGRRGMRFLMPEARADDSHGQPNLYLVEAPRMLLGDGVGRHVVDLPESAADGCEPTTVSTLCSLANFRYLKIVNADFAKSGSPAYALVYHYELTEEDAATIEELVALSGYNVGAVDVTSWINTHKEAWRTWLR
jgi:glycine betaine/proline transport system substrate-binding protein